LWTLVVLVNYIHLLAVLRQRLLLGLWGLCADEICCICDVQLLLCLLQVPLRPRIQLAAWLLLLLWLSVVVLGAWNVKVIVIVITTVIIVTPNIIVICACIIPVIASSAQASTTYVSMLLSTICSVACSLLLLLLLTSAVISIWRLLLLLAVLLLPLQLAAATTDGLTAGFIVQLQLQRPRHAAVTACGALPC
jgi:hypothetical protein